MVVSGKSNSQDIKDKVRGKWEEKITKIFIEVKIPEFFYRN